MTPTKAEPVILTKVEDGVASLTLNRPDKLNALSAELILGSMEVLRSWSADPNVGAILVTGTGRAFCAGGDVSSMAKETERTHEENIDRLRASQELSALLYSLPKV